MALAKRLEKVTGKPLSPFSPAEIPTAVNSLYCLWEYFQLGDGAKERSFSDLESSVCCPFQFCVPVQLTGSTSCMFLLVIFAINGWDEQVKSGHSGIKLGCLLESIIVMA